MVKRTKTPILIGAFLALILAGCAGQSSSLAAAQAQVIVADEEAMEIASGEVAAEPASEATTAANTAIGGSVAQAAAENRADHDDAQDTVWDDSAVTQIVLADDAITVEGAGATPEGPTVTIGAAGAYRISGSLAEGQVVVDAQDEGTVQLILDGVQISNSTTSPITVVNAAKTVIILAAGSENVVSDGAIYVFASAEADEPKATIFSADDLTISGEGTLIVEANYNDGIASKDGLIISGGTIMIDAADDGIRGKDYLVVKDGSITITAGGDGLKSDEEEDAGKGYVAIEGGAITITSGDDGISAATDVLISGGDLNITTGGGSDGVLNGDTPAKGIRGTVAVTIDGGDFTISAADDAIHANDSIVINGGEFAIATGDDGLHADATLMVNGGVIDVSASYEGLESAVITINDGDISIVSSDDGINVAGGNDGSGFGPGARPPGGGRPAGGPGQDTFATYSGDYTLTINGGTVVVNASGDGIDANGAMAMTDGLVIIHGPTEQMNSALDHDGGFMISGGTFVAAGSAGMAQTADASSTQNALLLNFNGTLPAGTLIHIEDSSGNDLLTFATVKATQSIAFSSPSFSTGETYTVYTGGSASGTSSAGLYEGASYTPGTETTSFTVADTVTAVGSSNMRRR